MELIPRDLQRGRYPDADMKTLGISLLCGALVLGCVGTGPPDASVTTVALRVHRMDAMLAFYTQAFGVEFQPVDTSGLPSQFGELRGLTIKFVPLRDSVEFEEYPSHQLGFEVDDVAAVVALATAHGGRPEGELRVEDGRTHGCVRDPDGNTIELYGSGE